MTTENEKQFFDTFGIEPKYKICIFKYCKNKEEYDCENCNDREWHYPQITDSILLQLICICSQYGFCSAARNIKDLKIKILKRLSKLKKNLKNNYEQQDCHDAFVRKIRKLFKEVQ